MGLRRSKTNLLMWATLCLAAAAIFTGTAFGSTVFSIVESGSTGKNLTVMQGDKFALDVIAEDIQAEGFVLDNLDAFTYRIIFPNENFTLIDNKFASPFDNKQAPSGFNGSLPWYTGTDIAITNNADSGTPGATPLTADLYRTTATETGSPVSGKSNLLETLTLLAPSINGDYIIDIDILEASDAFGEFHTARASTSFTVSVVPIPPSALMLLSGFACIPYIRRRLNNKKG